MQRLSLLPLPLLSLGEAGPSGKRKEDGSHFSGSSDFFSLPLSVTMATTGTTLGKTMEELIYWCMMTPNYLTNLHQ